MKNLIPKLAITLSLLIFLTNGFSKSIPLSEALKKNLVKATFKSSNKEIDKNISTYWGECIKITLQNLTSNPVSIQLEPGLFLLSEDTTEQRMIIVDNQQLALLSNESKTATVNAFCSQMHKRAPTQDIAFNTAGYANGNLLTLANYIVKNKFKSFAVQNAIWAITDNNDLSSIYSENTRESDSLRKFVSKLKGIPFEAIIKTIHVDQKITNGKFKFDFNNKEGGLYSIYLYNSNGELMQEFKKDFDYPHYDKITVSYKFQTFITAGTYFIRVVRNGNEIVRNFPIQVK